MSGDGDSSEEPGDDVEAGRLDALADRLREVRRQLMRGRQLASAFEGQRASPRALRAAERLASAIRRLDENASPRRSPRRSPRQIDDTAELPWLVRVIERRAAALEEALKNDA